MQLTINGSPRIFIPINQFRAQYALPDIFGVRFFEPKDYTGLAALDQAGEALNGLRSQMIALLPAQLKMPDLMPVLDHLQDGFDAALRAINPQVGLREPEIGFAVAGLGDMLQTWGYALIRAQVAKTTPPDFQQVYAEWLQQSVRVSSTQYDYTHENTVWQIQIVNHVYGRVGLVVRTDEATLYVQDMREACPAEGFMLLLLRDITDTLLKRLQG